LILRMNIGDSLLIEKILPLLSSHYLYGYRQESLQTELGTKGSNRCRYLYRKYLYSTGTIHIVALRSSLSSLAPYRYLPVPALVLYRGSLYRRLTRHIT
jgi:hypothetical protein